MVTVGLIEKVGQVESTGAANMDSGALAHTHNKEQSTRAGGVGLKKRAAQRTGQGAAVLPEILRQKEWGWAPLWLLYTGEKGLVARPPVRWRYVPAERRSGLRLFASRPPGGCCALPSQGDPVRCAGPSSDWRQQSLHQANRKQQQESVGHQGGERRRPLTARSRRSAVPPGTAEPALPVLLLCTAAPQHLSTHPAAGQQPLPQPGGACEVALVIVRLVHPAGVAAAFAVVPGATSGRLLRDGRHDQVCPRRFCRSPAAVGLSFASLQMNTQSGCTAQGAYCCCEGTPRPGATCARRRRGRRRPV